MLYRDQSSLPKNPFPAVFFGAAFWLFWPFSCAYSADPANAIPTPAINATIPNALQQRLQQLLPGVTPDQVLETPFTGLFEVVLGTEVVYLSQDGRFMVKGELIDLQQKQNLTENRLGQLHNQALAQIKEEQMIIFAPENYEHTITVFTDIDCGYCRKLHSEMPAFAQNKIRVRYLFYPRSGLDTPSYQKAVSVWCAANRQQALTDAKLDRPVPNKTCTNPVSQHMALGQALGVNGTPTIVLDSGQVVPGYIPPAKLAAFFQEKKPAKQPN